MNMRILSVATALVVVFASVAAAAPNSYRLDKPGHRIICPGGRSIRLQVLGSGNQALLWEGLKRLVALVNARGGDRSRIAHALTAKGAYSDSQPMIYRQLMNLRLEGIMAFIARDADTAEYQFRTVGGQIFLQYRYETDSIGRFYQDDIECGGKE